MNFLKRKQTFVSTFNCPGVVPPLPLVVPDFVPVVPGLTTTTEQMSPNCVYRATTTDDDGRTTTTMTTTTTTDDDGRTDGLTTDDDGKGMTK